MKKYLILLVALAMVLGISGIAMATEGTPPITDNIAVTATVGSYAAITGIEGITINHSGAANTTASGSDTITVERNCSVSVAVSTTTLTLGTDTLTTAVTIDGGAIPVTDLGKGIADHVISVSATTGAISAQAAGDYSATVTVTVSAV